MKVCCVDGCNSKSRIKEMCEKHYARQKRGKPLHQPQDYPCKYESCERQAGQSGWCRAHYMRSYRAEIAKNTCTIEDCDRPQAARGMCNSHWLITRQSEYVPSDDSKRWLNNHGYICVYMPSHPNAMPSTGLIYEHRLVMSEYLGRLLNSNENVHHINGDRTDNRIENLELWNISQPSGQRVDDKISWAISFLKDYGYEVQKV